MSEHHPKSKKLIAIGSTCIDFFIPLPSFPKENGKYRINRSIIGNTFQSKENINLNEACPPYSLTSVGGNVSNFLFVHSRLCNLHNLHDITSSHLCTVIAKDLPSSYINQWHQELISNSKNILKLDGVIEREGNYTSPVTYILVVKDTRTCIHMPCEEMKHLNAMDDQENLMKLFNLCLSHDVWIYSDTRHGDFVNPLIDLLIENQIFCPLILDCEKWRGDAMKQQLMHVSYCFTNSDFPFVFWESFLGKDMKDFSIHESTFTMWDLRKYKEGFILRTLGDMGSYMIASEKGLERLEILNDYENFSTIDEFINRFERAPTKEPEITFGKLKRGDESFILVFCTACIQENIIDTTGAGDSFIGTFTFYLQHSNKRFDEIHKIASKCSSLCLTGFGNHFTFELNDIH